MIEKNNSNQRPNPNNKNIFFICIIAFFILLISVLISIGIIIAKPESIKSKNNTNSSGPNLFNGYENK